MILCYLYKVILYSNNNNSWYLFEKKISFLGLWAIVQTEGLALPGIIERQESSAWESMLRQNLVAPLRTARVFIPLLRAKRGNYNFKINSIFFVTLYFLSNLIFILCI